MRDGRGDDEAGKRPAPGPSQTSREIPASKAKPREIEAVQMPALELPKGGGAIRGIGEKVSTNLAMGTSSVSVPIKTSPGREGAGPSLGLSYSSGAGNGIFGLGWGLGVPSVSRRIDKHIPTYAGDDTFLWGDEEELVEVLTAGAPLTYADAIDAPGTPTAVQCERFRPRVEGSFARIERVTETASGNVFWRVTTSDNTTHIFGRSPACRIADPAQPARVLRWLLERTYDDRGNVAEYEYKQEDLVGVDASAVFERHRGAASCGQRHIKRIRYGNRTPYDPGESAGVHPEADFMFVVVFDYGDHATESPALADEQPWVHRQDPFSTYRQGFELRTRRLCQRVLMFHRIDTETPDLVAVTRFEYTATTAATLLTRAWIEGHGSDNTVGSAVLTTPPLDFTYIPATIDERLGAIAPENLQGLPEGLDGSRYRWVDLDMEGIPGFLTEQGGHWFYKRNLGSGRFGHLEPLPSLPNFARLQGGAAVTDLGGDGGLQVVAQSPGVAGYFERSPEGGWEPFRAFPRPLNVPLSDPNVRLLDLDGDGLADVLVAEDDVFCWYPSEGREGYAPGRRVQKTADEERGARLVFADIEQSIYLADMSGDGLTDLVRIRNGSVVYWPNQGYGRFGAKVTMAQAPRFDTQDAFQHERLRLADVDGTGTADLLYLGPSTVRLWRNHAGNRFGAAETLHAVPSVPSVAQVQVVDMLGQGTGCVVWSSPLPGHAQSPLRYDDLFRGKKPYLLERVVNNLGAETVFEYATSTRDYLADRAAGRPWVTKLPFPVQIVARVRTRDLVTGSEHVASYRYHHGHYDRVEKEFRGFGMVEQTDAEDFAPYRGVGTFAEPAPDPEALHDPLLDTPPIVTKTWFHTGAWIEGRRLEEHFRTHEYYLGVEEAFRGEGHVLAARLPMTTLPTGVSPTVEREACRALRGRTLRTEVYANDDTAVAGHPYQITEASFAVVVVESQGRHAVLRVDPAETITWHTERNDSDPRIGHEITLEVDAYGAVRKAVAVSYPRRVAFVPPTGLDEDAEDAVTEAQERVYITYSETEVVHAVPNTGPYRIAVPVEARGYEVRWEGTEGPPDDRFFRAADFATVDSLEGAADLQYHEVPETGSEAPTFQRRLLERSQTLYWNDALDAPLALGTIGARALPFETRVAAFSDDHLDLVYGARIPTAEAESPAETRASLLAEAGGYVFDDGLWWARGGCARPSAAHFYQATEFYDPWHVATLATTPVPTGVVTFDAYDLFVVEAEDILGNTSTATHDYHLLAPLELVDPNLNRSRARFDALGRVVETYALGKASLDEGDLWPSALEAGLPGAIFSYSLTASTPQTFVATEPVWAKAQVRTVARGEDFEEAVVYSDGFGRVLLTKTWVEPEEEAGPDRWIGSGRTVFNNKGLPVKQYEPYFSTSSAYDAESALGAAGFQGVTPVLRYDPMGRLVQTDLPDGTLTRTVFTAWSEEHWDANDLVEGSAWEAERSGLASDHPKKQALVKALVHRETPARVYLDTLARPVVSVGDNTEYGETVELHATRVVLDIQSRQLEVIDAKGQRVQWQGFDMLGRPLWTRMMDSDGGPEPTEGAAMPDVLDTAVARALPDVAGQTLRKWTDRGYEFLDEYDVARRLVRVQVRRRDDPELSPSSTVISPEEAWVTTEYLRYGEDAPDAGDRNLLGRVWRVFDQAGMVASEAHDYRGNLIESTRRLTQAYTGTIDWAALAEATTEEGRDDEADALLYAEVFTTTSTFDALGRPVETHPPRSSDGARATTHARTVRMAYNQSGLLARVEVQLGTDEAAFGTYVDSITYNARRQRTGIVYGNSVETALSYDAESFRLTRLYTTREVATDTLVGQDLRYSYDAVGNITRMDDHAVMVDDEERMVHAGPQLAEPVVHAYTYDALGRLIAATGREHPGLLPTTTPLQPGSSGYDRGGPHPNDLAALEDYVEHYTYDAVGNFLTMQHAVPSETTHSWTRHYLYEDVGNRLTKTHGGDATGPGSSSYGYDEHGNMLSMPHLAEMDWNAYDELTRTNNGGGAGGVEHHFQYDASGQRVRKVVEHYTSGAATLIEERVYFGGYELYRRHQGAGTGLDKEVVRELQTLHVMDGEQRVALVDTRTVEMEPEDEDPTVLGVEARTTRVVYQLGNHLGSACLEVDEDGEVVRYEEYHPYGSSALLYAREGADDAPKRYRFTGMECDDTGLQYHSARYYAPWLGRWASPDPSGVSDGLNTFKYCQSSPAGSLDHTGREGVLTSVWNSVRRTTGQYVGIGLGVVRAVGGTALGVGMLAFPPTTGMAINGLREQVASAYRREGGGLAGLSSAVNEFNPVYHALVGYAQAGQAVDRGEHFSAGVQEGMAAVHVGEAVLGAAETGPIVAAAPRLARHAASSLAGLARRATARASASLRALRGAIDAVHPISAGQFGGINVPQATTLTVLPNSRVNVVATRARSVQEGFDRLAMRRSQRGMLPAHSAGDNDTLAHLYVRPPSGTTQSGPFMTESPQGGPHTPAVADWINRYLVTPSQDWVGPVAPEHAEGRAILSGLEHLASNRYPSGTNATLFVDRPFCPFCSSPAGIARMAEAVGINRLTVYQLQSPGNWTKTVFKR